MPSDFLSQNSESQTYLQHATWNNYFLQQYDFKYE